MTALQALRVHADDNVGVALEPLSAGATINVGDASTSVVHTENIPAGHKFALRDLATDESVVKYGLPIGRVTQPTAKGAWIHTHNLVTRLSDAKGNERKPINKTPQARAARVPTFIAARITSSSDARKSVCIKRSTDFARG